MAKQKSMMSEATVDAVMDEVNALCDKLDNIAFHISANQVERVRKPLDHARLMMSLANAGAILAQRFINLSESQNDRDELARLKAQA